MNLLLQLNTSSRTVQKNPDLSVKSGSCWDCNELIVLNSTSAVCFGYG